MKPKSYVNRSVGYYLVGCDLSFRCYGSLISSSVFVREYGIHLIELSNSKDTSSSSEQMSAAQKATQSQKLLIEKYIGNTKTSSKCAHVAKRHFQTKGASA